MWALVHAPGNARIAASLAAVRDLMLEVRDGAGELACILRYILEVSRASRDDLRAYVTRNLGPKAHRAFMTAADQIRQEERALQQERMQEVLFAVLAARGLPVSDVVRGRIDSCHDFERLAVWIRRAAVAESAADAIRPG